MAGMDHPFGDAVRQVPLFLHDRPELDRKGAVRLLRVAADQPVRGRRAGAAQDPPMIGVGGAHRQAPLGGLSTQRLGEFGPRMAVPVPVEISGRTAEDRLEGLELRSSSRQRRLAPIRAARLPLGELQVEPQLGPVARSGATSSGPRSTITLTESTARAVAASTIPSS